MGRKPTGRKRQVGLFLRLTAEEMNLVRAYARDAGKSVSALVRELITKKKAASGERKPGAAGLGSPPRLIRDSRGGDAGTGNPGK
jgi:hypothetical protein